MSGARNHSVQGSRNVSGRATPEGNWDEEVEDSVFDEEWTEEKEQELKLLETKLKKANRQWSDKQEEVLGPVSFTLVFAYNPLDHEPLDHEPLIFLQLRSNIFL